jgi:hypothetical protein
MSLKRYIILAATIKQLRQVTAIIGSARELISHIIIL